MGKRLKVLVIDGNLSILDKIEKVFREEGLDSDICKDFESAWQLFSNSRYALVITQYTSSTGDFCRKLREMDHSVPIILMYGQSNRYDLSETLKKGCDDFIIKPLDASELVARVRLALGRIERIDSRFLGESGEKEINIDGLYIDPFKRIVLVDGSPVDLTVTEFKILHLLALSRGRAYSRRELINLLWDYDAEVYEHTVNSHVNRLRAKIEDDPHAPRYIITVWGVGYRFGTEKSLG
jgi:DNA-binding response OmpR family regulator